MKYFLNIFVLILLLGINPKGYTQEKYWVDIVMATYPEDIESIEALTKKIDYDFKAPKDKVRALYLWLASNIDYDVYNEVTQPANQWILYSSEADKARKMKAILKGRLDDYFINKKALCKGYSGLFELGCELMGIKAASIHGFSKVGSNDIAKTVRYKNHSWNAVWLEGRWQFLDITWSAGYEDTNSGQWIKYLNDYYYLTSPEVFITSHYPMDSSWQLLQRPISETQFFAEPIYYPAYFEQNYSLDVSQKGKIYIAKNTIKLEFKSLPEATPLYYSFDGQTSVLPVTHVIKNRAGNYEVMIPAKKGKYQQLTLFTEFTPILDFKIAVN
ncbi:MAG: transglutaminase domain-containing protein [Gilvibacter sp.]